MAVLHLLANPAAAESCLAVATPSDAVLLLGDGVFATEQLSTNPRIGLRIGALREDATARGVALHGIEALSDADFVDWVVANDRSVTWT